MKKLYSSKKLYSQIYEEIQLDLIENRKENTVGVRKCYFFRLRQPNETQNILFYYYVKKNSARRAANILRVEKIIQSDLSKIKTLMPIGSDQTSMDNYSTTYRIVVHWHRKLSLPSSGA